MSQKDLVVVVRGNVMNPAADLTVNINYTLYISPLKEYRDSYGAYRDDE